MSPGIPGFILGRGRRPLRLDSKPLLFLPAYSPDLNPIEPAFGKIKARLRRLATRAFDTLVAAIGQAVDAITPADARAFYVHRGFPLPDQKARSDVLGLLS